jgi:RNA polymerase sigma-70 factor (ECF subfamily)
MDDTNIDLQGITLIKLGGAKREEGIAILYKKYARILRSVFLRKTRTQADAEDLLQETFIKIVKNCESYRGEAPLSAWIRQIAKNTLMDYLRYKQSHPTDTLDDEGWVALENASDKLHVLDPPINGDTLEDCVSRGFSEFAKDEPERAKALSLVVEGYDTRKIAGFINRTEGATREYLSQCRKKVQDFLLPCRDYLTN